MYIFDICPTIQTKKTYVSVHLGHLYINDSNVTE